MPLLNISLKLLIAITKYIPRTVNEICDEGKVEYPDNFDVIFATAHARTTHKVQTQTLRIKIIN